MHFPTLERGDRQENKAFLVEIGLSLGCICIFMTLWRRWAKFSIQFMEKNTKTYRDDACNVPQDPSHVLVDELTQKLTQTFHYSNFSLIFSQLSLSMDMTGLI